MGRSRSRIGEDPEEAEEKKPKLSMDPDPVVGSRIGEDREEAEEKKPKLSMDPDPDPVVSGDSSTNGASERLQLLRDLIPDTVVCFRYRHPEFDRFRPKLAEFGEIVYGPSRLPFLDDFAYVHYSTQDAADKALRQPIKIPKLGEELTCRNVDDAVLEAVRQAAYNLVAPHVPPHPANTLLYVSHVHCEATLDLIKGFFSQFGEIAEGPISFEMEPDSEFGITLIVYKTEHGAKEAVRQPHYLFAGHQVFCTRDFEAIAQLYQEMSLNYLDGFVRFFMRQHLGLPPPPLRGAHI